MLCCFKSSVPERAGGPNIPESLAASFLGPDVQHGQAGTRLGRHGDRLSCGGQGQLWDIRGRCPRDERELQCLS